MESPDRNSQHERDSLGVSGRNLVIISGLKDVSLIKIEEIHALEAHYSRELREFFGQVPRRAAPKTTTFCKTCHTSAEVEDGAKQ